MQRKELTGRDKKMRQTEVRCKLLGYEPVEGFTIGKFAVGVAGDWAVVRATGLSTEQGD